MTIEYIRTCNEEVKKKMMRSSNSGSVRIEKRNRNEESFVGLLLFFFDKTATILNSIVLVSYLLQAIRLNASAR